MPIARIVTRFPERAASLRKTLLDSGYHVEVVRPEDARNKAADIQYDIDEMPEYASPLDAPAEREFIFAPQWRALKARFGKIAGADVERNAPKMVAPSVSYSRLEPVLDEKVADQPDKRPTLLDRMQAMRAPLTEKWDRARQEIGQKRLQLAQEMTERRAAAEESRRIREAELGRKREADRIAAERVRAEQALRMQEQQARDAERLAQVQAQMERRRQQEQERAEAERLEAEKRARLEAERQRAAAIARETASAPEAAPIPIVSAPGERRRTLREIVGAAFQDLRDWRGTLSSTHFTNTHAYALRQYAPAAAGIALAFFLGWAIAIGGARRTAAHPSTGTHPSAPAVVPAAVIAAPAVKKPSAVPQKATATKPKTPGRRFRGPSEDDEVVWKNDDHGSDDDVTIIHHYPGKSSIAHSGKKNGVKTISDLEQD